jgi:hypothetical protein
MKQKITLVAGILFLFSAGLYAQSSFNVQFDTVSLSAPAGASEMVEDRISTTSGTATIAWKVMAADFPADWVSAYCLCDNHSCYPGTSLWTPSTGTVTTETSHAYDTAWGNFDMLIRFTDSNSTGCHYMTVRMNNSTIPTDIKYETYLICNSTTGVAQIAQPGNAVVLYPNPALNEINIVYDTQYDVRDIALCDMTGRTLAYYKAANGSAHLDLNNIPARVYFLKLMNSHGETIVTKRFEKE